MKMEMVMAFPKGNIFSLVSSCVLLLFFSHFGDATARAAVRYLPGFNGPLPFHLETGYVGVGELNEDQLFYYFVESERNPKEDPLMLWMTGGPGCSGWTALFHQIGPLKMEYKVYNGSIPTLLLNPYSWTKIASIIFVDSPVWTGFSYSKRSKDKGGDIKSARDLYEFLRKWLDEHPQFLSNPLYIGGDSYSGLTLPIVVQEIVNGIEAGQEPILNLKGYLLGNPFTDYRIDVNGKVKFLLGMGIISDELYESAKKNCKGDYYSNSGYLSCAKDIEKIEECGARINVFSILEHKCPFMGPGPKEMPGLRRYLEENSSRFLPPPTQLPTFGCRGYSYLLSYYYANNHIVRKVLHVRKGTIGEWVRCNLDTPYKKELRSSIKYHLNLTTKGYPALIYSGDHDLKVTFVSTQAWIRSLNFSVVDEWRPWIVDGQVAGFTRTYANNLTFATVKGAGHTAPEYKPKECLAMLQRWISRSPL